jgi:hypothetical protein
MSVCRLDYGYASVVHMAVQTLLFYGVFVAAFHTLGIKQHVVQGLCLASAFLFLTPAGLAWFERGQFSLYVATSYLLLMLGFLKRRVWYVLVAAAFAFVKWTSLPYVAIALAVFLIASKRRSQFQAHLAYAGAFVVVFAGLFALMPSAGAQFVWVLYMQERFAIAGGMTAAHLLPFGIAKTMPLALIVIGYVQVRAAGRGGLAAQLPFLLGAAIILLTYPTVTFDYNVPALIGFIPLMFYWASSSDDDVPERVRTGLLCLFLLFILAASNSKHITWRLPVLLGGYAAVAGLLFAIPLYYRWRRAS